MPDSKLQVQLILNNLEEKPDVAHPREAILKWLEVQPYLTAEQIAKLDPQPRRGGQLKPFSPKNKKNTYPGSIVRTYHLLNTMLEKKMVQRFRVHNNEKYVWHLPKNPPPPNNWYTRQHETDVADLFVAYYPYLTHWDTKWGEIEKEELNIPRYRVFYDARMVLNGKVYLWEVDRGTEEIDVQLEPKIDKYIEFSQSLPYGSFQVLFTLQKYRRMDLAKRAGLIGALLQEKKRGNQFLYGYHNEIVQEPLGEVFTTPIDPEVRKTLPALPYGNV